MSIVDFLSVYTYRSVLVGTSLIGAIAGALGCFAYVRHQSLASDVISHSALPGVLLAFLFSTLGPGAFIHSPLLLVIGAAVTGTAAHLVANIVASRTPLTIDAAMATTLSLFFGTGMLLLQFISKSSLPGKGGIGAFLFGNASTLTKAGVLHGTRTERQGDRCGHVRHARDRHGRGGKSRRARAHGGFRCDPSGGRTPVDARAFLHDTLLRSRWCGREQPRRLCVCRARGTAERSSDRSRARRGSRRVTPVRPSTWNPRAHGRVFDDAPHFSIVTRAREETVNFILGTCALAVTTALATALPGVFVVLRKSSMMVDGMSHAVLPGVVIGYALTHSLTSPLLIVGAAGAGLLVVLGSEALSRTRLLAGDASQGLVFPALFSAGVLLISIDFGNVHLDEHAVLVGDVNLAAWTPLTIGGIDVGPQYLYVMLAVLALNIGVIAALFPRLTVTTYDPAFAQSIGVRTGAINVVFMFLTSLTVTAAFHAAGAVLVLALVVIPAATARLWSIDLRDMVIGSVLVATLGTLAGFWLAYVLGAATSAGMAVVYGLIFFCVLAARTALSRVRPSIREP